jgi:class 3 adenylate cyclase
MLSLAKSPRVAALSSGLMGIVYFTSHSVFGLLLQARFTVQPFWLIPLTAGCAAAGYFLNEFMGKNRRTFGLKDPVQERQELLRQLMDLQERLKGGEQSCTFLSVDVVASTALKSKAPDQFSIEYSFSEYHDFVNFIVKKHSGRIHSTAGDGVTATFDTPQQAFAAAKNLQVGLIELNTFRNKLGSPIILRCGIHSGAVNAPDGNDLKTLNFSEVIDIAAHLQKACPPGGIAVSQYAAVQVQGGPKAIGSEQIETSGVLAYIWTPRNRFATPEIAPPPLPN